MMATLAKRFTFDAAHCLPRLPPGHKCARLHGHTYEVEIVCRGQVDERGFVVDYDDIAKAWEPLREALDHRYLNDIPGLETPSTEHLVAWMFGVMHSMSAPPVEADASKKWATNWLRKAGFPEAPGNGPSVRFWEVLERIRIKESSSTWCEMTKVEWVAFCGPNE